MTPLDDPQGGQTIIAKGFLIGHEKILDLMGWMLSYNLRIFTTKYIGLSFVRAILSSISVDTCFR